MNYIRTDHGIYLMNEKGEEVAKVIFQQRKEGEITVTHTFVDSSLQGQGIAKKLMDEVCKYAQEKQLIVLAECSYAVRYLEKHTYQLRKEQ